MERQGKKKLLKVSLKARMRLLFVVFVMLMVVAGHMQYKYDSNRNYWAEHDVFVTLPSGKTLKVLCFGFRNLTADLLFIWSIQFYSNYNLTNSYEYLEHIYNTIAELNPRYKEPYLVGSWIMSLEAGKPEMAIRLLQRGAKNMPDQWIFDYESGFYAFKDLKDYELAEKYFNKAAANPEAPTHVRRKTAHMVYMKNDLKAAYRMWIDIYNNAEDLMTRDAAHHHLFQIKYEMDKKYLEQQAHQYKEKYNRFPHSLELLKKAGLIREIPKDMDGHDYVYHSKTGKVTALKEFRWKK